MFFVFFYPLTRRKFSAATNGTCEEELTEKLGAWDFVEHSQRSYCSCSRSVASHVDVHYVQVLLIYVCSKRLYRVDGALNTGTEGHSQQNICKLYPRLDFDKHIILDIFQFIAILSKWQPCWGWNLYWAVCFCKSDIFIPTLMGIIWGRKNSLTSDGAPKGYCGGKRSVCVLHTPNVDKWAQHMSNEFICICLNVTVVFIY